MRMTLFCGREMSRRMDCRSVEDNPPWKMRASPSISNCRNCLRSMSALVYLEKMIIFSSGGVSLMMSMTLSNLGEV